MTAKNTKRERLLDWIRNGDPNDVPVMFYPGFEVASSYMGKDQSEMTWDDAIQVAETTGTHNMCIASGPLPFHAIPFVEDVKMSDVRDTLPDGTSRVTTRIETPEGTLTSIIESPKDKGAYHRDFFVKSEDDLPAFACFIRKTTEEASRNPAVADRVRQEIEAGISASKGAFPSSVWMFCPAVELTSSYYMDQERALFALYDHQDLMEELMECHWRMTDVWLDLVRDTGVDICQYAINGFEWLNPDIYRRYMIPQARRINERVTSAGKLSWIHTCGKMKHIAAMNAYQDMKVDVVESLSLLPEGDVDDLSETRSQIGSDIVTRGSITINDLYSDDTEAVRKRADYVLDSVSGYKHMIGDSDGSYPSYPWKNIEAVIDVVKASGRLYE